MLDVTELLVERRASTVLVTLNRPAKLNALSYELIEGLQSTLDALEEDAGVRCVILTGAGDRAFSAGADIAGFEPSLAQDADTAVREFLKRGQRLTSRIESFPKPIIAAVNGLAFGGGCEIVEAAPLAIASEQATFAKPEIKLGILPTFGGSQRLARLAGRKRALHMLLTGDAIDAAWALDVGLVNAVAPKSELLEVAFDLARRLEAQPPLAVSAALTAVTRGLNVSIDEGLAIEAAQFARLAGTDDAREGVQAFLQKRSPVFRGR